MALLDVLSDILFLEHGSSVSLSYFTIKLLVYGTASCSFAGQSDSKKLNTIRFGLDASCIGWHHEES